MSVPAVGLSDTGRKRRHNEDSYVCEPPLFAVADGMGGAQAGEIASQLAAAALREETTSGLSSEERVVALIREANRRVFESAHEDRTRSGMGTTVTVAIAEEGRVVIGHVGDSRAYRFRDGRIEQLTDDHSLVAELVRSGKISAEEAETHPQRSVITRALGTESDIDVDTFDIEAREGDLFLLCSDGLSTMVDDETLGLIVERSRGDLKRTARDLIDAANRAGGEDNITVVLFEPAGGGAAAGEQTATMDAVHEEPSSVDEDTLDEEDAVPAVSTFVMPASEIHAEVERTRLQHEPIARDERSYARRFLYSFLALALVVLGLLALLWGLSRAHFVGAEENGAVAVYQGVPYDIAGDVKLYRPVYVSELHAALLRPDERAQLFDHDLRGEGSALAEVRRYEAEVGLR
jgi:PPM family protein phosphatase